MGYYSRSSSPILFLLLLLLLLLMITCHDAFPNQFTAAGYYEVEDSGNEDPPFTYLESTGKGPSMWGLLNPEWAACSDGKLQSPIDLSRETARITPRLGKLEKDYKPAPAVIVSRDHDINVKWYGDAGHIIINGTRFNVIQCHWHTPTEHSLDGMRYELELHIVHLSNEGRIAVIGILYEFGRPDSFLEKLYPYIKNVSREETHLGVVDPSDIEFGSREYFRYNGSLTSPPCTEGVTWTVIKKVRTASMEQVEALRNAVDEGFENNARPIQPRNGRPVRLYTPLYLNR
ncbi:hypothetical protein MLD38_020129 [Melastoma candidum]|uniref:Uncharacterized protein n=1 Tax=Melastoma candidum TaxID=119954 RepID=A0ACB9QEY4_9MYRT|nr:hypothetical protein MLD38_020129 [Melastoma candidum]